MITKYFFPITILIVSLTTLISCQEKKAQNISPTTERIKDSISLEQETPSTPIYKITAPKISEGLNLCGEEVPVNQNFIYEKIDRELLVNMYWQSQTFMFIKRAHKWFPIIEPILKENNIPDDFKYLAIIESGLMNVTSPSGAKGFWQFMPRTAKGMGLEVNEFVDERYNVEIATKAACEYLNKAYQKFDNWTLAAASYNMGKAGLERRLTDQKVNSYYDLLLNQETGRYVYRILAVKEIISSPNKYGFYLDNDDYYNLPNYNEVKVDSSITDLVAFAKQMNMNYNELKTLNPWLRDKSLTNNNNKVYFIKTLK